MAWEIHQPAGFRASYGADAATCCAEGLKSLLESNGLSMPRFPGMVWAEERLPGGEAAVVGIAESDDGPLAYLLLAGRVELDHTEEVEVQRHTPGGAEAVMLHWHTPQG